MVYIADPVTRWAFLILVSVVMGTCLLIAVAFIRRWQQIRYSRYIHTLQRRYRPMLAMVLAGARNPCGIEALRELPLADMEHLLDPLFARRKLSERQLVFLQALCAELGLIALWQKRTANGHLAASKSSDNTAPGDLPDRAVMRYVLRAKSIRNLGKLRHQPSWSLLVNALDDGHPDIQLVALRSLAALGAPEGFHVLRERLHAVVQGESTSPPTQSLLAAMASFDLACLPALLPSLCHANRQIRLHATEILQTMVCREAVRHPCFTLTEKLLTPPMVELLLTGLAVDISAEVRARAAEVLVFLDDPRATPVLHNLLLDPQWFVRLRTLRALAHLRQTAAPLRLDIRDFLHDPHWQVREAAIHALISLGQEERHQLYEYYLTCPDRIIREQIVEVIQRTGLMSALVEEYCRGTKGVDALVVEQLATDAAPTGLAGIFRTLSPEIRQKFLERFPPSAVSRGRLLGETRAEGEKATSPQNVLEFPPYVAA
jgi:HEAT repeat protein